MNKQKYMWPVVIVLLGASSYGLGGVIFKLAIADGWSVENLTLYQVLSGAVLLWALLGIMRLRRDAPSLTSTWRAWFKLATIGVVGLSLTTVFYNEALSRLDASLAIVLLFQFTWITIVLECIRKRKLPSKFEWIAVFSIAVGTILAVGLLEHDFHQIDGWGVLFGLLSAVTYSLFFFLTDLLPHHLDPLAKSAVMSTASLIFVVLLQAASTLEWNADVELIGWGIILGFLSAAFPFFCFNYGIPKIGGALAALLGSMELPAAVVAAFFLLGEPLTLWQGLGVGLIIIGIMAAQRKAQKPVAVGKEGER